MLFLFVQSKELCVVQLSNESHGEREQRIGSYYIATYEYDHSDTDANRLDNLFYLWLVFNSFSISLALYASLSSM